jgi:hypothetical protein
MKKLLCSTFYSYLAFCSRKTHPKHIDLVYRVQALAAQEISKQKAVQGTLALSRHLHQALEMPADLPPYRSPPQTVLQILKLRRQ